MIHIIERSPGLETDLPIITLLPDSNQSPLIGWNSAVRKNNRNLKK